MARPKLLRPRFRIALRGGRYSVEFWWEGRAHRVSTGTTDQRKAREFLASYEAGWGKAAPPAEPTIGVILDGYIIDRKGNSERPLAAPESLDAAAVALKRHLSDLRPEFLTRQRCRLYTKQRRAEGYEVGPAKDRRRKPVSDGTVLRELGVLRAALAWAVNESWLQQAPHVEGPPTPQPRDRWLTREEAQRLISCCGEFHVRVFTMLALHTAARSGAILDLKWANVSFDRRRLDYGFDRGNKRRVRAAPITDDLLFVLSQAKQLAESEYVVEFAGAGVSSIRTGFLAACRRAELPGVTPHVLRHTAATWMAQNGASMWEIAGLLGNSIEMVTRTYTKHSPDHLRRAASAMEGISSLSGEETPRMRKRKIL